MLKLSNLKQPVIFKFLACNLLVVKHWNTATDTENNQITRDKNPPKKIGGFWIIIRLKNCMIIMENVKCTDSIFLDILYTRKKFEQNLPG